MPLKKMFDVFLAEDDDDAEGKVLIILAEDETEAQSLAGSPIAKVVAYPGLVSAVGASRIIGWSQAPAMAMFPAADEKAGAPKSFGK